MALRLIFEADGERVRVVRAQRVEMIAPELHTSDAATGVFAEMRDANESTLYRANLSPQLSRGMEVFSPDGAMTRIDAPERKQLAMLVVPDHEEATDVVVVRRGAALRGGGIRAEATSEEELDRMSLRDLA